MKIPVAFVLFTLVACSSPMSKVNRSAKKTFDLQGHRGCRGLMPENTIAAMLKAIDLGVNTLEMDAVITSDKQVILSHEPFFNHEITLRPDGREVSAEEEKTLNIYKMTFAETQTYDVGLKPNPRFPKQEKRRATKPLLSAVIDSVEAYCKKKGITPPNYNIETKSTPVTDGQYHPTPAEFVDLLMGIVRYKLIDKRVIIQSFDERTLQYLHQKHPSVKTALLVEYEDSRSFEAQLKDLGFTPTIYSPAYALVTPTLIEQCRKLNMLVIPWTVNNEAQMKLLKAMGVDGLITDYPNLKF